MIAHAITPSQYALETAGIEVSYAAMRAGEDEWTRLWISETSPTRVVTNLRALDAGRTRPGKLAAFPRWKCSTSPIGKLTCRVSASAADGAWTARVLYVLSKGIVSIRTVIAT